MRPRISFQNRINNDYFSGPILRITFTKNIFMLCNSDSIINFKFRSFRIDLNFFGQSKIISISRFLIKVACVISIKLGFTE